MTRPVLPLDVFPGRLGRYTWDMDRLLIRGGTVVSSRGMRRADVLVEDGVIAAVEASLPPPGGCREVDAEGLLVLPGGIDPHVHLSLPAGGTVSADDFDSGSAAALAGGTTTIVDFVTPRRDEPLLAAHRARRLEAAASRCDLALHGTITSWRPGMADEMASVVEEEGVTSFKIYLAYLESIGIDDGTALRAMEAARSLGATVLAHCENGHVVSYLQRRLLAAGVTGPEGHPRSRPPEVEEEAVGRAILLARSTGCPLYVVHVSTAGGAGAVAAARREGLPVHGETCPHYLLLDESLYREDGFEASRYVLSPPLRTAPHREALWRALAGGGLEVVATDHCPFTRAQKERGRGDFTRIPGGAAGLEPRLPLLFTHGVTAGRLSLERFVELTAEAPARLFGLAPQKGAVVPGADADLVLWDAQAESVISAATHHHRTDLSLYEGWTVTGGPRAVYLRGRLAFDGRRILAVPGSGRLLRAR